VKLQHLPASAAHCQPWLAQVQQQHHLLRLQLLHVQLWPVH
jgi:hypothetical protein